MDLTTGELEKIDYEPLLNPRYSSAITVVGDELYIWAVEEINMVSKN